MESSGSMTDSGPDVNDASVKPSSPTMSDAQSSSPKQPSNENNSIDLNLEEMYYDLSESKGKRVALVFNHETFNLASREKLSTRVGSENDVVSMKAALESKGFLECDTYKNLKYYEIIEKLNMASQRSDICCLVVVIMSHGTPDMVYADDTKYQIKDIWKPFMNTLVGIPKLFFIQACRGTMVDSGVKVKSIETDSGDVILKPKIVKKPQEPILPQLTDFLMMYSTYEGYYSWREADGSWFITALCKVLEDDKENEHDLLDLLTFVNREVAVEYMTKGKTKETDKKKQMPQIVTCLTKFLNFK